MAATYEKLPEERTIRITEDDVPISPNISSAPRLQLTEPKSGVHVFMKGVGVAAAALAVLFVLIFLLRQAGLLDTLGGSQFDTVFGEHDSKNESSSTGPTKPDGGTDGKVGDDTSGSASISGPKLMDKPFVDDRKYGLKTLNNGIRYLAIEDASKHFAGLAAAVKVGSLAEPSTTMGLAHLVEHTVFCGSVKFPSPTGFNDYSEKYMGGSNAYTSDERTVYFADLESTGLRGMFERVADFLYEPLLNSAGEVSAVHAEHMKNQHSPNWRLDQLFHYVFDKDGVGRFSTGDKTTLGAADIPEQMKKFVKEYYYSKNFVVASVSSIPLQEQLNMAVDTFGGIPNTEGKSEYPGLVDPSYGWFVHLYAEESPKTRMQMVFPMEFSVEKNYRAGIDAYMNRMFNVEGRVEKQGLLGFLLDQGLVIDCGFYVQTWSFMTVATFEAELRDTSRWEEVIEEFYKYMRVVRAGVDASILSSIEANTLYEWQWSKATGDASSLAVKYAEWLSYDVADTELLKTSVVEGDAKIIQKVIDGIQPKNMLVFLSENGERNLDLAKASPLTKEVFTEAELKSFNLEQLSQARVGGKNAPLERLTLDYYNVKYTKTQLYGEGSARLQQYNILLSGESPLGPNMEQPYQLPAALKNPPEAPYNPLTEINPYKIESSDEEPYGPGPTFDSQSGMWLRRGSTFGGIKFMATMKVFSQKMALPLVSEVADVSKYARMRTLLVLWKTALAKKLAPLREISSTCGVTVSLEDTYQNLLGLGFTFNGFYGQACESLFEKVLEVLADLRVNGAGSSMRGESKSLVGRASEGLYLRLTDFASKMPINFAYGALADATHENAIPDAMIAKEMKKVACNEKDSFYSLPDCHVSPEERVLTSGEHNSHGGADMGMEPMEGVHPINGNSLVSNVPASGEATTVTQVTTAGNKELKPVVPHQDKPVTPALVKPEDWTNLREIDAYVYSLLFESESLDFEGLAVGSVKSSDLARLKSMLTAANVPAKSLERVPIKKTFQRSAKINMDMVMASEKPEDVNDVIVVRIIKPGNPSMSVSGLSSVFDVLTHELINAAMTSFTFSQLRTMKLQKDGNSNRYIVRGTCAGPGNYYAAEVAIQFTGEVMEDVVSEAECFMGFEASCKDADSKNMLSKLKEMSDEEFETYKTTAKSLILQPPSGLWSEFYRFGEALDEPSVGGRGMTICDWQRHKKKLKALSEITKEDVVKAWEGFLDVENSYKQTIRLFQNEKDAVLYRPGAMKPEALFAKKNTVEWWPAYGGMDMSGCEESDNGRELPAISK